MKDREKKAVGILRERWGIPDWMTDDEIKERMEGTLEWALINLGIAGEELKQALVDSTPRVKNAISRLSEKISSL